MLNLISILSTFLVAQIVMMSVLNLFLGRIVFLNVNVIKGVLLKDILFFLFNTFILVCYTTFYLPH
jgi:hypothetical protein